MHGFIIFARIGHGPYYYHWNEIFAGVSVKKTCLVCLEYTIKKRAKAVTIWSLL